LSGKEAQSLSEKVTKSNKKIDTMDEDLLSSPSARNGGQELKAGL